MKLRYPQPGERRGPMVCVSVQWPDGDARWVPVATLIGETRYVKTPGRGYMLWKDLEAALFGTAADSITPNCS